MIAPLNIKHIYDFYIIQIFITYTMQMLTPHQMTIYALVKKHKNMNLQTFSVVKFTFFLPRMTDGCEDNTQFRIRPQNCGLRGKAIRHGAARPQVSSISHRNSAPSVIQ